MDKQNNLSAIKAAMATREAAMLRVGLRDRLCIDKPGKPGNYSVRVSATCVARTGPAKAAAQEAARERRASQQGAVPSMAATRAEARILEREMTITYPDKHAHYDTLIDNGDMLYMSHLLLEKMMNPRARLLTPNPLERYNKLAKLVAKRMTQNHGNAHFDVGALQRHMILRATLAHVKALIPRGKNMKTSI